VRRRTRGLARSGVAAVAVLIGGLLTTSPATAQASQPDPLAVARTLSAQTRIPGTAWLVDPGSHTVVAIADRTVTGARLDRLNAAATAHDVRVQRVAGTLGLRVSGGDPILGGGSYRCTLGANVTGGGVYYFVTAGHCGTAATTWTTPGGAVIGSTVSARFPADDYALVRYTGQVTHEGTVGGQDITSAGSAHVGEHVCMRGSTTGVHCGTVLALNATVNYAEGTVSGLIETNICSEPGDSGAPLYDGAVLLGLLSGGSGDCGSGGLSFFQPITEVLSAYGLSVY